MPLVVIRFSACVRADQPFLISPEIVERNNDTGRDLRIIGRERAGSRVGSRVCLRRTECPLCERTAEVVWGGEIDVFVPVMDTLVLHKAAQPPEILFQAYAP